MSDSVPTTSLVKQAIADEIGEVDEEDRNPKPDTIRQRQVYEKGINPFKIFTKCGKVLVTLNSCERDMSLDEDEIQSVKKFHRFVFSDALWIEDSKQFLPDSAPASYYIIPVNKNKVNEYEIDWPFMSATFQHSYNTQKMKTSETADRTIFNEGMFMEAVLMQSCKIDLWKLERPTFHHVVKVRYDLSPNSALGKRTNKHKTHKNKLHDEYGVVLNDDSQPLVETIQYPDLQMWVPIYVSAKTPSDGILSRTETRKDLREILVPEMSIVHPFPHPFFFKVNCLPTILFRVNGLLLAEEIRQAVAREAFVGIPSLKNGFVWPIFNLETSDKDLTEHLYTTGELKREDACDLLIPRDIIKDSKGDISSFEVKFDLSNHTGPAPSILLQALTAKSAEDEFDLERLEFIGDSFMKYIITVKSYIKYKKFNEGGLTAIRSSLVRNLHLYQKAKKKNLGQYMTTVGFNWKKTWLPPCYVPEDVEDVIDASTLIKKNQPADREVEGPSNPLRINFTKQVISAKCIADSVEALIGSYLLSCGHQGALRFMSWFGLKPLVEDEPSEEDFKNWPPSPPDPIVGDLKDEDAQKSLDNLTEGFIRIQKIIGHKFKNKAFLLQAFTHPSYTYNNITDSYERLEFLGDAVLDYMITRQLYEDPSGHSPGKLTDMRSALVNNMYFASLAVVYSYNDFVKMLAPQLFGRVNRFLEIIKDTKGFQFFEKHRYYEQGQDCLESEEDEVPKVLGDIFESVAGAIYLDSGMSLDTVWKVYYPMIKPAMDHLHLHVPVSPVRELCELVKTPKIFGQYVTRGDKMYCEVILPDGRKFEGVGPTKEVAKKSAAKKALAELKAQENSDSSK